MVPVLARPKTLDAILDEFDLDVQLQHTPLEGGVGLPNPQLGTTDLDPAFCTNFYSVYLSGAGCCSGAGSGPTNMKVCCE